MPGIAKLLQPVEDAILQQFIPALTGQDMPGEVECDLFALPTRLGGLGIANLVEAAECQFEASMGLAAPLLALVVQQHTSVAEVRSEEEKAPQAIRSERRRQQARAADQLRGCLPEKL